MRRKLLHISSNVFPALDVQHTTKKIWEELSKGFQEYHILARSEDHKFHNYKEGNIYLHLVPNLYKSKTFIFTSFYMIKLIKKYDINILLAQCPILGGALATFISKKTRIPIMVEIHGMEYFKIIDSDKVVNKVASVLMKYSLKNATKIRSLSPKMTEMLIEKDLEYNIVEIPNRVNFNIFNQPKKNNKLNETIKVISVGRFVWEKAYDVAIKAVVNLQNKYDIELTLIGGGPLKNEYKEIINGNTKIKLIEWISQENFVPLLSKSDIYIQPSVSEGMPRSILEAMALKLPVVVSDVGAISGVIRDKKNGLLIQPGDVTELELAIIQLIENQKLRESISNTGYTDVVSKYEWNVVFEKYRNELLSM